MAQTQAAGDGCAQQQMFVALGGWAACEKVATVVLTTHPSPHWLHWPYKCGLTSVTTCDPSPTSAVLLNAIASKWPSCSSCASKLQQSGEGNPTVVT
jgi:hypothetical protein